MTASDYQASPIYSPSQAYIWGYSVLALCHFQVLWRFTPNQHNISRLINWRHTLLWRLVSFIELAGHPISAIRAYLMASLILIAASIDRHTVTLRNLNLVALIFVICIPSAIYQPAFQLSFAATYGIVMFHDAISSRQIFTSHKWARAIAYIIITSLIAVLSTFLFSAYHFGITTLWGVAANIIAIPFTAMIVMPAGVVYLLSLIIGLNAILAPIFDFVLSALISFAGIISNLPYAGIIIKMPPSYFLILFAIWIGGFYYASAKIRTALISILLLAIIWIVTPAPLPRLISLTATFDLLILTMAHLSIIAG